LPEKLENGGWQLWVDVMKRDPKAQSLMSKYCAQDVEVLEKLFLKIRPIIATIPNYNLFTNSKNPVCPSCGDPRLKKHGKKVTRTKLFQRYICGGCGSVSQQATKDRVEA